jgi:dihydropteroate synthase
LDSVCYLGVLNLTPDSFSDGGAFIEPAKAIDHAAQLLAQGARVIDIGAESTRPGAEPISPHEEWSRIEPVLSRLIKHVQGCALSIDTRHPEVAAHALDLGADIVNDVTGFKDTRMLELAARSNCGLIAVRSRMKNGRLWMPDYDEPRPRIAEAAVQKLKIVKGRLLKAGVEPTRILLDPGFGFGTTFQEDLALWDALARLPIALGWPIERFCIGVSRKRFIAKLFGVSGQSALDAKTDEMQKKAAKIGYKVFRTHSILGQ